MVMQAAIDSGIVSHMRGADAKTYLVLAAYARDREHPSLTRIAANSGLCVQTVCKSIRRLQDLGAIAVEHRGGTNPNYYTINSSPHVDIHVETTDELDLPEVTAA